MKILLIEDDVEKLRNLEDFLRQEIPEAELSSAQSFASGLRLTIAGKGKLDLVLLDMSMHNYDISLDEPGGGNPEPFAGRELLAQMKLRGILTPVIVVTMFDSFGDENLKMSLSQLTQELSEKFSPPFQGVVQYDARQEGWRAALKIAMKNINSDI